MLIGLHILYLRITILTKLITNEDGSIQFECPHYIPSNVPMIKCKSIYPCEPIEIYDMSIILHCSKGIVLFNWIDRFKIIDINKLNRMISLRFYKQ
jgi:hypothetical protein